MWEDHEEASPLQVNGSPTQDLPPPPLLVSKLINNIKLQHNSTGDVRGQLRKLKDYTPMK